MHRITRAIVPALALAAGSAHAQFIPATQQPGQGQAGQQAGQPARSARSNLTFVSIDNGKRVEVRLEDGRVVVARVDGQDVPEGRVRVTDSEVVLLDEQGETAHRFSLVAAPQPPGARTGSGRSFAPIAPSAPPAPPMPPRPPVMLGLTFIDPGEALRAHLGLGDRPALLVNGTIEGLPAHEAGIRAHDVIVSIDGSDGASGQTLSRRLADAKPGEVVEFTVIRAGSERTVRAELAAFDAKALGVPAAPMAPDARSYSFSLDVDAEGAVEAARQLADEARRGLAQQMIELREGRVFVRSADEINKRLESLQRELDERAPGARAGVDERLRAIEQRMEEAERRFEDRMKRLDELVERLADRLGTGRE